MTKLKNTLNIRYRKICKTNEILAKIAFILLCHKDPEEVIEQAERLKAAGDFTAIHFDGRAKDEHCRMLVEKLGGNPNIAFAARRIKCGWGEWSLVEATILAVEAALKAFPKASHFYMLSGDCMSIKSASYTKRFLDAKDAGYIEVNDFFESSWIKKGIKGDRLFYRHYFNERTQHWLFYKSLNLQRALALKRQTPTDIQMHIGSQWWCLRCQTVEKIFEFLAMHPKIKKFFKKTLIPDETFFQTLVAHLIPKNEIENRTLTFLVFSDYGMPANFYNDHFSYLADQDYLFARKISNDAKQLKARLGDLYAASTMTTFSASTNGRQRYEFLTNSGRHGRRFGKQKERSAASGLCL